MLRNTRTCALTDVAQLVGHCPAKAKGCQFDSRSGHAWVVGQVTCWGHLYEASCMRQSIDVSLAHPSFSCSLSPSLLLSLKINKENLFKKCAPKYIKQILTDTKGETDGHSIIVGDFNIPLSSTHRSSRQKMNKKTLALNDTLNQRDDSYI